MRKNIVIFWAAILLVGCGSQQQQNDAEQSETASIVFRDIDVKVEGNQMHLTGEAKASEPEMFYEVIQGEKVLEKESKIDLVEGHLGWSEFEIKSRLPGNVAENEDAPIVMLYVKGHNGKVVNPNYIPVDIIND